jgi:putative Flp pilus-assembly TadE/G-like protein
MTRPRSLSLHDQAGLIGKVAVVWIVVLALVGLLVLDGISVVLTTLKLSNTAQGAASIAATQYRNLHDLAKSCTLAEASVLGDGVTVPDNDKWCKVDPATGQATITLHTTASSLVLGRLSFTQHFTDVTVKESAEPAL